MDDHGLAAVTTLEDDGPQFPQDLLHTVEAPGIPGIPGTPGLQHRVGGIEKEDGTGNISYAPRGWSEWAGTCDVHFKFGGASLADAAAAFAASFTRPSGSFATRPARCSASSLWRSWREASSL